jgi:pathogenesis-related protein 1
MRVSFSLVAFAVVVAAASCGVDSAGSALDDEQVDAFVAAHNDARAAATPTPDPPLPPLAFDADLARTAQEWSARCVFEHSTNGFGENLAAFSGADSSPDDVVDAWASENEFFDYESNTCVDGQQCGHYTQIVWRDTQRVGCGVSSCTFPELGGAEGLFWVCNYDPPGNFDGERPY